MSAEFRLLTYGREHPPCAGVLVRDHIFPAATLLDGGDGIDASSMLTLLRSWEVAHPRLHEIAQRTPPVDGLSPRGAMLAVDVFAWYRLMSASRPGNAKPGTGIKFI